MKQEQPKQEMVDAYNIAKRMGVTARFILKLADRETIPCIRLGKKCVRFFPDDVSKALGFEWKNK